MTDGDALSWRLIASGEAQADLDGLLDSALRFAQRQLARDGGFFPFAMAVTNAGAGEMIAAGADEQDKHPDVSRVVHGCVEALRDKRNTIRAAAVTSDVRLRHPTTGDAIQVDLEHVDGHTLTVLLAYAKKRRGKIEYGALSAQAGDHRVWAMPNR